MTSLRYAAAAITILILTLHSGSVGNSAANGPEKPNMLGLPPIPYPDDNPQSEEKVALGQKLFFDMRLSRNDEMSCGFCHRPHEGFTENSRATPIGLIAEGGNRNTPTLLNVAYYDRLFLDGRETSLETQYISPLTAAHEMANPSIGFVVEKLKFLDDYEGLFEAAFGAPVSVDTIGKALGAYQRTLVAANTPFDKWRYANDKNALTDQQKRGFEIFFGNHADCASCHQIEKDHSLFTDNAFHDIGYGWMREQERLKSGTSNKKPDFGRYAVTDNPLDRWRYRTPTLRNIELTAPYMHDGRLKTLEEVVDFYNKGGAPHEGQDIRIKELNLSDAEQEALVAFLKALTSPDASTFKRPKH